METAGDKPVQRKQGAGEEFPLWIINIDNDGCERGRQISQGDSRREKENHKFKKTEKICP